MDKLRLNLLLLSGFFYFSACNNEQSSRGNQIGFENAVYFADRRGTYFVVQDKRSSVEGKFLHFLFKKGNIKKERNVVFQTFSPC